MAMISTQAAQRAAAAGVNRARAVYRTPLRVEARAPQKYISRPRVEPQQQPDGARASWAASALETPLASAASRGAAAAGSVVIHGVHHVALICASLEASLEFYCGVLGLEVNPDRPHDKLPYRGAWLWIGPEMIHLMELPNPDPADADARPHHGGRDRHFCIGVAAIEPLVAKLEAAGVAFTKSASGRPAVFFRDPDANVIECVEGADPWR